MVQEGGSAVLVYSLVVEDLRGRTRRRLAAARCSSSCCWSSTQWRSAAGRASRLGRAAAVGGGRSGGSGSGCPRARGQGGVRGHGRAGQAEDGLQEALYLLDEHRGILAFLQSSNSASFLAPIRIFFGFTLECVLVLSALTGAVAVCLSDWRSPVSVAVAVSLPLSRCFWQSLFTLPFTLAAHACPSTFLRAQLRLSIIQHTFL